MLRFTRPRCVSPFFSSLDAALEDDDAAIRALNNNIDANGTGSIPRLTMGLTFNLASMLANLIQDGKSGYLIVLILSQASEHEATSLWEISSHCKYSQFEFWCINSGFGRGHFVPYLRRPGSTSRMGHSCWALLVCERFWPVWHEDETNSLRGYWKESFVEYL